ncbi:MAG TPA: LytTR family transcriptional regulator DNA-binding domain-containing protein [Phenylobacterium sp.]|nr:LytTR family transcriptional regulator DNA-binding domain-containing protein [Phenylobacterium sp.]
MTKIGRQQNKPRKQPPSGAPAARRTKPPPEAPGSALILMRLSDAVSRTGGEGLQVHRSWWVAKGAIRHVSRERRNLRLNLLNGLELPVARRAVTRLKDLDLDPG